MGNAYKGISDEKFIIAENEMLKHSGVSLSLFEITNVFIDEEQNYIRTYQVGNREN